MSKSPLALYCDSAASMPILPEVWNFLQNYGSNTPLSWGCNLSSDHSIGLVFQNHYETMSAELFRSLKCAPAEWFWTSGATESNEWALQIALSTYPNLKKILIHPLAHPSLSLCASRIAEKYRLALAPLPLHDKSYQIDFQALESSNRPESCLLALPYGDNELGSIESDLSRLKAFGWVHFDAAQSFAKIPLDLSTLPCTSLSCSGYKFGALPSLGGLYVRLRPKKKIIPLFVGGSQQNGLRAGTLPFLLLQTFCIAFHAWNNQNYGQKLNDLRTQLFTFLENDLSFNVHSPTGGLPHIVTFEVPHFQKEAVLALRNTLAFSQGSACQKGQGSPALAAIGFSLERQKCLVRIGLSPYNLKDFEELKMRLWQVFHCDKTAL